jgi:hypothetical protein
VVLPEALEAGGQNQRPDLDPLVISIEAKLQRAGKGKRLVIENGAGDEVNAGLAAIISEAFSIRNQLLSGSDDSVEAMTERLGIGKPPHFACSIDKTVRGEPVSASQFPVNREFNREFFKFGPFSAILAPNKLANSNACSKIP